MFAKLSGLFQGWLGIPLKTGLVFWLGGFFLWLLHIINWEVINKLRANQPVADNERFVIGAWKGIWHFLRTLQEHETAILIVALVAIVLLSGVFVQAIQFKLLRSLEGYGWFWDYFESLRLKRIQHYEEKYQKDLKRWKELTKKTYDNSLTISESREYAQLDKKVTPAPRMPEHRMPTRLGNILRGYEQRPYKKYGLDVIICWSRLWLVLPKEVQAELSANRQALDESIQLIVWSILFFIWIIWSWLAIPIAIVLMIVGYLFALKAADIYGQLIEATFDVHRGLLYKALNREIPKDPDKEKEAGLELTRYLWRGGKNPDLSEDTKIILPHPTP
jgi:hypothetical protein